MGALSLPEQPAEPAAGQPVHYCHDCDGLTDDHRLEWFYPGGYRAIRWLCHDCYDARRQMTEVRGAELAREMEARKG